jgi:hypothetical protein
LVRARWYNQNLNSKVETNDIDTKTSVLCRENKTKNEDWLLVFVNNFLESSLLSTTETSVSSSMAWASYGKFKPTTVK